MGDAEVGFDRHRKSRGLCMRPAEYAEEGAR